MKIVCVSALLLLLGAKSFAAPCTYDLDKKSVTIGWTAFKTSEKLPVKGTFKNVTISGKTSANQLAKLVEGFKVSVDPQSLDTANPARNDTIIKFFFNKMAQGEVSGHISRFSAEQKSFTLALAFNGQNREIAMTFTQTGEDISAQGSMNLLDFGASEALASLNKQCFDLHKGKDGVSKTWSDVALNFQAKVKTTCTR